MQHKPTCSSKLSCLVYHGEGVPCPGYKSCDCGATPTAQTFSVPQHPEKEALEKKIEKLEKSIAYENHQYEIAQAYPTENAQFYDALERNRLKIEEMYRELDTLKKQFTSPEKEVCKCELDGFQGAITSQNCGIHNTQESWEERFDEKFLIKEINGNIIDYLSSRNEIKHFISSLLQTQAQEIEEKVKFLGKEQIELYKGALPFVISMGKADEQEKIAIYRQALSDVLLAIKQVTNK